MIRNFDIFFRNSDLFDKYLWVQASISHHAIPMHTELFTIQGYITSTKISETAIPILQVKTVREFCRAILLTQRHWQCLPFDLKALSMPFFWAKIIANACNSDPNALSMPSFSPWNGKFSLTIGMIMPLGWGEVTGIIPKLVAQGPFGFPTRHL